MTYNVSSGTLNPIILVSRGVCEQDYCKTNRADRTTSALNVEVTFSCQRIIRTKCEKTEKSGTNSEF